MNQPEALDTLWHDRRILVVSPHPDDETFGCAGTMVKAKGLGSEVFVLYVTVGNVEHYGRGLVAGDTRVDEVHQVAKMLDVDDYEVLYTDSDVHLRMDTLGRLDLVTRLERDARLAIDKVRPDVLLVPAPSYNQDHEAVYNACMTACRPHLPAHKPFVAAVMSFDQPQLAWGLGTGFKPNLYVDISKELPLKLRAHECYVSQALPNPHPASVENVERIARVRGSEVCLEAAEAFQCHRLVS